MRLLFLLLSPLLLSAQITLKELQESPEGRTRDFYIWQYMKEDISSAQADAAYSLVERYNHKIFMLYLNKTDNKTIHEQYRCSNLKTKELLQETNTSCINTALSLDRAMGLESTQREDLSLKLKENYPQKSEIISLMNKEPFILSLLQSGNENFLKVFNSVGKANRQKYFNIKLSPERINELAKEKSFNSSIDYIVRDENMFSMQESLLSLSACELNDKSYFLLGLNALHFKATKKAMFYFELAQKTEYAIDKDKAVFWMYLISKDEKYLQDLSRSNDINIYTLYANEKLNLEVNNYFYELKLKDAKSTIELNDPYVWEKTIKEVRSSDTAQLEDMLEKYNTKEDEALNAFIYAKSIKYKKHNYIMPYKEATQDLSKDDKAILYSLAKQESHFIPSALSHSYAIGVMQMMPFLIENLAKEKHEDVTLDEMFDPYKNIQYSKKHIKWIQKSLYHPLFIAYAYNGGMGFTKRHLEKGTFERGSFEPYLSMELMSNTESREYGKKVLANYVIYKKILGEEVKIISLFESLTQPSNTDRFRSVQLHTRK